MLQITLTEGTELQIGDDIRVIFREATYGRARVAIDAPREKIIQQIKPEEAADGVAEKKHAVGETGKVYAARNGKVAVTKKKS